LERWLKKGVRNTFKLRLDDTKPGVLNRAVGWVFAHVGLVQGDGFRITPLLEQDVRQPHLRLQRPGRVGKVSTQFRKLLARKLPARIPIFEHRVLVRASRLLVVLGRRTRAWLLCGAAPGHAWQQQRTDKQHPPQNRAWRSATARAGAGP